MAKAIRRRVWERRARQEEPINEASISFVSEEDPVEELSSLSKSEEDPVTLSSSSSEGEYEGTTTPSRLDDDPVSSPALAHRPVTGFTPKKSTSRPKRKAYKSKTIKPGTSSRERSRGQVRIRARARDM